MTILLAIASHVSYHQVELSIKTKYDLRFRAKVNNNDFLKLSPDLEKYSRNIKTEG